jgi:hypothetical protein
MNAKLEAVINKIRTFPEETQEAIASELEFSYSRSPESMLTQEQLAIVDNRLSRPMTFATPEEVEEVFKKYR